MKTVHILSSQELKEILDYNKTTGIFTWIKPHRKSQVGKIAGTINTNGYRVITIRRKVYSAHRLAWLYINGNFPDHDLDHKDRNKSNNAFSNLRPCDDSKNNMNRELQSNNKSGFRGVHFCKTKKKWNSFIQINRKRYSLGYYNSVELAYLIREAAEIELFEEFSPL